MDMQDYGVRFVDMETDYTGTGSVSRRALPVLQRADDRDLLIWARDGDIDAWGEVCSRYGMAVFGVCLRYTRNGHDASDCSQTTFLKAYQSLTRFDVNRRFSNWILTIARNTSINVTRRKYRQELSLNIPIDSEGTESLDLVSIDGFEDIIDGEHRSGLVCSVLPKLDPNLLNLLQLKYYEGMTYAQISDELRIPEGTVKTRIHRAKLSMRRTLEGRRKVLI